LEIEDSVPRIKLEIEDSVPKDYKDQAEVVRQVRLEKAKAEAWQRRTQVLEELQAEQKASTVAHVE
jgi:hypothetical protein